MGHKEFNFGAEIAKKTDGSQETHLRPHARSEQDTHHLDTVEVL